MVCENVIMISLYEHALKRNSIHVFYKFVYLKSYKLHIRLENNRLFLAIFPLSRLNCISLHETI